VLSTSCHAKYKLGSMVTTTTANTKR
jgi:hypothetical protein